MKYLKEEHDLRMDVLQKEREMKEFEMKLKVKESEAAIEALDILKSRFKNCFSNVDLDI